MYYKENTNRAQAKGAAMTKQRSKTRAVGYVRVSTDDQHLGPEAQRAELERWAKISGVELVAVFVDHGVSGAAPLDKRLGLLDAIDALKELDAGLLLVAKRDRLARDVVAAAMIERMAQRAGAQVGSANGAGNGDGPESLLMRRLLDAFAEFERAMIRGRTRAAMQAKRARLEYTGGSVSYGWDLAVDGVHLVANPVEQAIVQVARELREAGGLSLRKIGSELERRGMAPRSGRGWHAKTVRDLLRAPVAEAA